MEGNKKKVQPVSTFVFDLGGVLMDWNPRYHYGQLTTDETKIEYFLKNICTSDWNSQLDAGVSFAIAVKELASLYPEWKDWISDWHLQWNKMLKGVIPGTYDILKEIKESQKFKLLALSNWSAETFPIAQARFKELDIFDDVLLSGVEKLIKPDPRFFQRLCMKHDITPEECFFVDDLDSNINVAKELGFQVHHFKSSEGLKKEVSFLMG